MSGVHASARLLAVRNLRMSERSVGLFFLRFLTGIILLSLLALLTGTVAVFSAPGGRLVATMLGFNQIALLGAGVFLYPVLIAEEREKRTLSLLRMAGFTGASFLVGQSLSALVHTLLILLVQLPFLILAVALGGTSAELVGLSVLVLLAEALFVYGVAMLGASRARTVQSAIGVTAFLHVVIRFLPWLGIDTDPYSLSGLQGAVESGALATFWTNLGVLAAVGLGLVVLGVLAFDASEGDGLGRRVTWHRTGRWPRFPAGPAAVAALAKGPGLHAWWALLLHLLIVALVWLATRGRTGWQSGLFVLQVGLLWLTSAVTAARDPKSLRDSHTLPLLYLAVGDAWLGQQRAMRRRIMLLHLAVILVTFATQVNVGPNGEMFGAVVMVAVTALFADRWAERAGLFAKRAPLAVAVLGGGALGALIYTALMVMVFSAGARSFWGIVAVVCLAFGCVALALSVGNSRHLVKLYGR